MTAAFSSHPSAEQLAAFDRGELGGTEWATVERHLASCAECCCRLEACSDDPLVRLVREAGSPPATAHAPKSPDDPALAPTSDGPLDVPAALVNHPRYRVLAALGAGGMGVLYRAEHRLMERTVALKVIRRSLLDRPGSIDRFRHEVRAAARLVHPNIVVAHDAEQAGEFHFLVMEFVEGESLDHVLKDRGPLPVAEACDAARQAALGLQYAHEHGMVHRDLKPGNLIRTADGRVKVVDFGLSRFISEAAPEAALTPSGAVVGTPDYIAPEQAADPRGADIRADIYSLGCTLFHLLTGRPPFPGGTALQKLIAHRERPAPALTSLRPDAPDGLGRVLERMLAKDPGQRYQTPGEAADALRPWAVELRGALDAGASTGSSPVEAPAGRRGRPRRWLPVSVAVAVCLVLAAAAILAVVGPGRPAPTGQPTVAMPAPVVAVSVPASAPRPPNTSDTPATPKKAAPLLKITSRLPDTHRGGLEPPARREAVTAWFDANNRDGPKSALATRWASDLSGATRPDEDLHLILGPDLVKSQKVTYVSAFGDGLFVFELTPEEARPTRVEGLRCRLDRVKHNEPRRRRFELSKLRITEGLAPPGLTQLSCAMHYRRLAKAEGRLAVRISRRVAGKDQCTYFDLGEGPSAAAGQLTFYANWSAPLEETANGPLIFFVELCSLVEAGRYDNLVVVSNTAAVLVRVVAPSETVP